MSEIVFTINGERRSITAPPIRRLLDVLREDLRLTGTKEGCGEGECGSCSVLLNGELVNSCLIPVLQAQGAVITTIEGLASRAEEGEQLHPIQQCFLERGGAQCGICTPGMILATHHRFCRSTHTHSAADSGEELAGEISVGAPGYIRIFDAVQRAAEISESLAG